MMRRRKSSPGQTDETSEEIEKALAAAEGDGGSIVAAESVASHGTMITVTWGEEVIQPIQYNGFRVGALTLTTPVLPNETVTQAYERVWRMLDKLGRDQFKRKLDGFSERLRDAANRVRSDRGAT